MRRCAREGVAWPREKEPETFSRLAWSDYSHRERSGDVIARREDRIGVCRSPENVHVRFHRAEVIRDWHLVVMLHLRDGRADARRGICSGKRRYSFDRTGCCREYTPGNCAKRVVPGPCVRWPLFDVADRENRS